MSIREQYVYVTTEKEEQTCIGIKKGKWAGVVYKYGKVSFGKETKDGNMPFQFKYDILDNNGIPREKFDDKFFKLIGDILVDIIEDQSKEGILEPIN